MQDKKKLLQTSLKMLIKEVNRLSESKKLSISYLDKNDTQLLINLIFFTKLTLLKNINTLLKDKNPIAIPNLVRSSIDLLILHKLCCKSYDKILAHNKYQLTQERKNFIKVITAKLTNHKTLKTLPKKDLFLIAELFEKVSRINAELNSISCSPKKISELEKRNLSKLDDFFEINYNLLSSNVHYQFSTLHELFVEVVQEKFKANKLKIISNFTITYYIYIVILEWLCFILDFIEFKKLPIRNLKNIVIVINKCLYSCEKILNDRT